MSKFKKGDVVVYDDMECTITGWDEINEEHILTTPDGEEITVSETEFKTVEEMTSEKASSVKGPASEKGKMEVQNNTVAKEGKKPVKDSDNENGVGQYESKVTRFTRKRQADAEAELVEGEESVAKKEDTQEDKKLLEDTAAGRTIKGKPSGASGVMSSSMVADVIKAYTSMDGSNQLAFHAKVMAQYGEGKPWGVGDVSDKNKSSIKANNPHQDSSGIGAKGAKVKGMGKAQVVTADMDVILGDETELSEELKSKMTTLFEAAVNIRVAEEMAVVEEDYTTSFESELEEAITEITENVDNYLNYVTEEWVQKNEVAIENSLQMELSNSLLSGLRDLFAEHYVNVPDEQVDIVEALSSKVDELESDLNEQVKANMKLVETLEEYGASEIFAEMSEGMVLTQVEKFRTLAESVDYEGDEDDYRTKLTTIRDHHFSDTPLKKTEPFVTDEDVLEEGKEGEVVTTDPLKDGPSDQMARYADAISRTIKR